MAPPCFAALHGVGLILPDGRILFTNLHETFQAETGICNLILEAIRN